VEYISIMQAVVEPLPRHIYKPCVSFTNQPLRNKAEHHIVDIQGDLIKCSPPDKYKYAISHKYLYHILISNSNDETPSISYRPLFIEDKLELDNFLGGTGKLVLEKVLETICSVAYNNIKINRIDVKIQSDPELPRWKYILLLLSFDCDFNEANEYLYSIYNHIDKLTAQLSITEQEILRKNFYFDVGNTLS
jgi:hypothetical protein